MRLLVVTQYFWPENFRINDLVGELVSRGHQVTVLTGYPNYPDGVIFPDFRRNPDQFKRFEGADVVRVPLVPRKSARLRLVFNYLSFALTASTVGVLKLRGRQFDAMLVYEPSPITVGVPAAVLRWIKKTPMAFWVLDLWPETLRAVGVVRSPVVLDFVGKLVSFVYNNSDLILASSRSFMGEIARYSDHDRIVYFPNWSESIFDSSAAPADEVPSQEGAFNVMFAGNIGDAQDFPSILRAAEILRSHSRIRWLIVGDGRMAGWVRQEISARSLEDSVLMLGKYPVERMPSFFMHAHALLLSLKDEPIFAMTVPGKLQSYLAAGIPLIGMLDGEGADVIRRAEAGLVCQAGDATGLAKNVLELASSPPERLQRMRQYARAYNAREFDRDNRITQLEACLKELIVRNRLSRVAQNV